MILIFHRRVHKAKSTAGVDTVSANIVTSFDGEFHTLGSLNFPSKLMWSKFIAALQRGVVDIKDMEVEIENVPDKDIPCTDANKVDPKKVVPK